MLENIQKTNKLKGQLLEGMLWRKTAERKRRLAFAIEGIKEMFEVAPKSYVSLSFGKQSICIAHMVFEVAPETPMYFLASDETWHMFNYQEVIERFIEKWPINLTIVQTHRFFDFDSWKEGRDAGDRDLQNMCRRDDWDGWFWGLSKDESRGRKITCSQNNTDIHPSIFRYADDKLRCTPIQNWDIRDLAAYLWEHDIPVLNIYEKYGLEMRTTARITKKARDLGAHTLLKDMNSLGTRILTNKHEEIEQ